MQCNNNELNPPGGLQDMKDEYEGPNSFGMLNNELYSNDLLAQPRTMSDNMNDGIVPLGRDCALQKALKNYKCD
jgi:hypothetical protein